MATPAAICPVCFVRFPVAETTSTATACPACAHKFAVPVRYDEPALDDEPVVAEIVAGAVVSPVEPRRRAVRPQRAERVEPSRTGFRRRDGEPADEDRSPTLTPLVMFGFIFGAASLLCAVIVLLVVAVSPPDRSGELAEWTPEPVKPFAPQPNPDPLPPFPNVPPVVPLPNVGPPGMPFPNVPPVKPLPPERPKVKMVLPAVTPVAMTAAPLTEDGTEVKLPGTVTDACVGGGGRFYCLLLGDKKQVAVFDVCAAKVIKCLPVAGPRALIAANMNELLVIDPDDNLVTRFDLTTFEKEATEKLPVDGKVKAVAMGSASAGPLLVQYNVGTGAFDRASVAYLDPVKFTRFHPPGPDGTPGGATVNEITYWRASPDGRVFGTWTYGHSSPMFNTVVLSDGCATHHSQRKTVGQIVPGPDGSLHTATGQFSPDLKQTVKKVMPSPINELSLPATSGDWYFTVCGGHDILGAWNDGRDPVTRSVHIKYGGSEECLVRLEEIPSAANNPWPESDFTADKRYLLVPEAKAFVAISSANDKLVVRKIDLLAAAEKSAVSYLFVASQPGPVTPGEQYSYQIAVKSKKGGVTYSLKTGPAGLAVSPTGRMTWAVPKGYTGGDAVAITVADKSGQQVFHKFELKARPAEVAGGLKPPAVPVEPPAAVNPPKPPVVVPWPGAKANADSFVMAPARPFDTPRTKLTEKTAVALPDSADAMCLGGGGRFVLYRLPKLKQLAVLDLSLGKVAKYLPLAEANAVFAAGMDKVFVYNPSADVFQRWSLETFEKEATVKNPLAAAPKTLQMGHSTDGPLAAIGGAGRRGPGGGAGAALTFLHPTTLKPLDLTAERGAGFGSGRLDEGSVVRVSGDGRVYAWHTEHVSPQGFNSVTINGKTAKPHGEHTTPWFVAPGADGTLFTGIGIHTPDHKLIGDRFPGPYPAFVGVPATAAPWYVRVTYADRFGGAKEKAKNEVAVALVGESQMALPLADHEGFQFPAEAPHPAAVGKGKPFHDLDRFVLNPRAGVLAIISGTGDKVHLHPLDLKAVLAKAGGDYLMVMSQPPAATKGQKWTYTPEVWSKTGKAVIKVETGPPGLTATGGTVTWAVPRIFVEGEAQVILTVSDGGKQETFHTFALPVGSAK